MIETQRCDILVLGSGESGKYLAWTMAKTGLRAVVVERALIGGSCPNIACLSSKNVICSAHLAALFRRDASRASLHGTARQYPDAPDHRRGLDGIVCKRT